ncbi:hypothetical protein NC796_12175 [Aliifodinibius sp. S!AR15-10]|uniref:VPS10 domain-containing protein n=1 Tax=Aliifodinibius sp. S!AR15-10 TaxID=2950437 RepID=UPI002855FB78|nr:hypothetical protein [Aliifodinibius sp. S!AR15-10]MDR8391905.1 hypothetical protein [Aliifodinibius sp. S!AR15-10]
MMNLERSATKKALSIGIMSVFVFLPLWVMSQELDMNKFKEMKPRNIGPAGMSGRVTAIDVERDNPDVIYAGTASGGLWKSESGGVDWKPIFDDQQAASIGAVDIYQNNPSIIWVGTGEGNPRNSQTSGAGVFKSIDGGRTWTYMGLEQTRVIHRVIVHPNNPDIVYVGAQGDAWSDSEHRGLYKTTDGGETWEKILYNNNRTGIADLVMDPNNPNKLFAAMWEFRRWPWFFESGGEGSGLYMTLNGGENWQEITHEDGLTEGELGRIGLAIARSNTDRVYAWVESKENAIYRSDDGGYRWEKTVDVEDDEDAGNRPFYYADIYVDPKNENRVYSLYSFLSVSQDGAKSFESIYPYYNYIHPDHHAFYIHPDDPSYIIDGNDGGLNISHDRGETWRFVENLPVAQYYHINVDMDYPYNVYGGMQDNGSWQGPAYVWHNGGIRNSYFQELYFGDGFDVVVDSSNSRYAYAMSQRGNVGRVDLQTGHANFIRPANPTGEELRFNWNAAIAVSPFDDETVYFGSQFVHKSTNRGDSWQIISPDLTTDDPEKQRQEDSGGLTIDATGAENFTTITAIAPSPLQRNIIWAGTDDGNVQLTRNGGKSWNNVADNIEGVPEGSWVAQVHASKYDPAETVVVINNYRRGDWTPYIMRTENYGEDWENVVEDKGLYGYALSFVQDPVEPNLMFAGTEMGLYLSIDRGETWSKWTQGYPTVSTYDMTIHPREHDLVIGTFGRSAWVLDDIRPLREMAVNGVGELDETVNLYPAPDAYLASINEASGTRFAADAIFKGKNRPFGARLTYSVVKPEKKEDKEGEEEDGEKQEEEKVKIEIFNQRGDLIRTLEEVPEFDGINRTTWDLTEKGVREPSRTKPDPDAPEPSGPEVLPGTYKVKMTYRGASDSANVAVRFDPRIDVRMADLRARKRMMEELMRLQKSTAEATNNLLDALEMIASAEKMIEAEKGNDNERVQKLKDETKAVKDSVNALLDYVFGEEDERQGITLDPDTTIAAHLERPESYISSGLGGPGPTERALMKKAREAASAAIPKINRFFETRWPEYVDFIESAELSPFRDFETVRVE